MIELVIIGERFYKESQAMMSAVYREKNKGIFYRYDWGFLQLDMIAGKEIHIRPATPAELRFFEEKLNEYLVKFGYQKGMVAQIVDKENFFDFVLPEIGKPLVMHPG
jgi:hypothetical protein